MDWVKLLTNERWGASASATSVSVDNDFRSAFDRDYGRILYSSAFRRLQDKTQVFPLGRNDYVRTRLTHSLEVAHIGSSLGQIVGEKLVEKHEILRESGVRPSHFAAIVASACLAHDLGNPPFGHFGESAIEAALARKGVDRKFEGNAQGFRLLTRVGDPIAGKGLRLTAAVLATFMKYPCTDAYSKDKENKKNIASKKFGFIEDDVEAARFAAEKTGLLSLENSGKMIAWTRHPLAFLVEAADDLSYLIADMEDAFISKIISFDAIREFLFPFISECQRARAEKVAQSDGEESAVHYVRSVAIGAGISEVCQVFLSREEDLLTGAQNKALLEDSSLAEPMAALRKFSFKNVYNAVPVVEIELMSFRVIEGLVDFFFDWIEKPDSERGKKIAIMLGGEAFEKRSEEARLNHLLDTISGMTDSLALATYRKLHGI